MSRGRNPAGAATHEDPVAIFREAYPRLLGLGRRLASSHHEAEDLVQEAIVETLARYPGFSGLERPLGYLATVMYRKAFRTWARRRREVPLEVLEQLEAETREMTAGPVVEEALASIGAKQAACLALRFLHDLDEGEIAAVLGCGRSTVRSQLARGLANARERIGETDDAD